MTEGGHFSAWPQSQAVDSLSCLSCSHAAAFSLGCSEKKLSYTYGMNLRNEHERI